jgi:hypothetical protein
VKDLYHYAKLLTSNIEKGEAKEAALLERSVTKIMPILQELLNKMLDEKESEMAPPLVKNE